MNLEPSTSLTPSCLPPSFATLADAVRSREEDANKVAELAMKQAGIQRFNKRETNAQGSERNEVAALVKKHLVSLMAHIDEARDTRAKGRRSDAIAVLDGIDTPMLAYIALAHTLGALVTNSDRTKVAGKVGRATQEEARFHAIEAAEPDLWRKLVRWAEDRPTPSQRRSFVLKQAKARSEAAAEAAKPWKAETVALVGAMMVRWVEKCGLVSVIEEANGAKNVKVSVELTDVTRQWLDGYRRAGGKGALPIAKPVYAPLLQPPADWVGPGAGEGGYKTLRVPLLKADEEALAMYRDADMQRVYDAVNTMQRAAWCVDEWMLDILEYHWAKGIKVGKLPSAVPPEMPEKLTDEAWATLDPSDKRARGLLVHDTIEARLQADSDAILYTQVLNQARDLKDAEAFYMVYQLDWRGRIYAVPLLNPQQTDPIRSLIGAANPPPVGDRGGMWLAIQCASLWDGEYLGRKLSKCSFAERHAWTEENEEMLRAIVADPIGDTRWHAADKPWMFLRTARDYVGFIDEGPTYRSGTPIALDGSCSGIQHYSALLRNRETGASVNLIAGLERPGDVYSEVAEEVKRRVEADDITLDYATAMLAKRNARKKADPEKPAMAPEQLLQQLQDARDFWLKHGINRKVVKKPVMTYGYSSREQGFTDWYEAEFVRPTLKAEGIKAESGFIARYLARHTLAAVETRLRSVADGMAWMIEVAGLLAAEGKGIRWTAPTGLPLLQRYTDRESVRVQSMLCGERIRVYVPGATETLSKMKQANAISPNHTHSLDASHLMFTVLHAKEEYGIAFMSLIHDSFGTVPAHTDDLFSAVREAFVWMYENFDPFQHLYDTAWEDLSEEGRAQLKPPPGHGDLEVSEVLESLYSFA